MKTNDTPKRRSGERGPVELSELCPTKCGCSDRCELDDMIFLSAALLDDYKVRMKKASETPHKDSQDD